MAIPVLGTVTLTSIPASGGAVTFDTDPPLYEAHDWPKRLRRRRLIGGGVTILDFSKWAADAQVNLAWEENALNKATVATLLEFAAREQVSFRLQDAEGNDFTVVIADFKPRQKYGFPGLYVGTMTLWVQSIQELLGSPYTGS